MSQGRLYTALPILLAGLLFTSSNLLKPLVIDDATYHAYAEQVSRSPGDPYGFEILWQDILQPAIDVVVPPVLPYWWGAVIAVVGERPLLWKLSLLPFALLLSWALFELMRRFARGFELPLTWMVLFSPVLLPAFNLMLDVPSLALSLASVALLLRACDEDRVAPAIWAGLAAGLAMQTKYNAVVPVVAALSWAVLAGRMKQVTTAGGLAALVFVGWESFTSWRYGDSGFLLGLTTVERWQEWPASDWLLALLSILGAVAPALLLLGQLALGRSRRTLGLLAAGCALPFASLPLLESLRASGWLAQRGIDYPMPEQAMFAVVGIGVIGTTLQIAWRRLREIEPGLASRIGATLRDRSALDADQRATLILLLWVALEVAGYFAIAPFFASRRVIGIYVASTLLTAHFLSRTAVAAAAMPAVNAIAAGGALLAVVFAVSDHLDARSHLAALAAAERRIEENDPAARDTTTWFVHRWGFGFEAGRRGMRRLVADESRLERGDWLLVPSHSVPPRVKFVQGGLTRIDRIGAPSPWPWSTLPSAYAGPLPIRGRQATPFGITIYRVRRDFVPLGRAEGAGGT